MRNSRSTREEEKKEKEEKKMVKSFILAVYWIYFTDHSYHNT